MQTVPAHGIQPRRDSPGEWRRSSPSQAGAGGGGAGPKAAPEKKIRGGGVPDARHSWPSQDSPGPLACRVCPLPPGGRPRDPDPEGRGGNIAPPWRFRRPALRVPQGGVRRPAMRRLRRPHGASPAERTPHTLPDAPVSACGECGARPSGSHAGSETAGSCPPPRAETAPRGLPRRQAGHARRDGIGASRPGLGHARPPARDRPCGTSGGFPAPREAATWPEPAPLGPGSEIGARASRQVWRHAWC
jgi:hypothetical protein